MATPAQFVYGQAERDQARRETLEDRQREDQEHLLATAAANGQIPISQAAQGMDALYAHEPVGQRFKRLGTFLEGIVGKKPKGQPQSQYPAPSVTTTTGAITNPETGQTVGGAPVTVKGPAPRNGKEFAGQILSGAKSPQQVYAEQLAAQNNAKMDATKQQSAFDRQQAEQNVQDFAATYKRITGKDPSPDILQAFTVSAFGGDKVLSTMEQANALKAREEYQNATLDLRAKEQALNQAKFDASQNPNNPTFRLKLQQASTAYENAETRARTAEARYQGTWNGAPLAGDMIDSEGNVIPPVNAANVRPTGQQRERATLATSALDQMNDLTGLLTTRSDLFGPGKGHITNFRNWIGSQDPDAQKFKAAARTAADHLAGVFGGRSQAALDAIYDVIGNNITNPKAAIEGINQMAKAADVIQQVGSYRTVGGGGASPVGGNEKKGPAPKKQGGAQKPIVQYSKSRNAYRYSTDGGTTWQSGKPPQ